MPKDNPKYEVAISFLAKDENIAAELNRQLSETFDVFFFLERQKELAGTDGMETMRTPFYEDSRLMVVLYRDGWGKTRWTAIEELAIKDACFNGEWNRLFFIALDRTSHLPGWIPPHYVRYNWEDFGAEQVVGIIKARVLENGGEYKPLTPVKKAEMNRAEEAYRRAKSAMTYGDGPTKILSNVKDLFYEICRLSDEVNAAGHDHIEYRLHLKERDMEQVCTIAGPRTGIIIVWYQPMLGTLEHAYLAVREFNENMIIQPGSYRMIAPEMIHETKYDADLSRTFDYGWSPQRGNKNFISSKELASQCVIQFLDLMNRDASGKVPRKSLY